MLNMRTTITYYEYLHGFFTFVNLTKEDMPKLYERFEVEKAQAVNVDETFSIISYRENVKVS